MRASTCTAITAVLLVLSLPGAASAQTPGFIAQEGPDLWRASKLPGVAIFGTDKKKVGDITDVLLDHTGKATAVVIGVGGFLGLGEKDVALPFDQVTFTQEPLNPPQPAGGMATTRTDGTDRPAATGLAVPTGATGNPNALGAPGAAPGMNTAPDGSNGAAAPGAMGTDAVPGATGAGFTRSTAYPDHGMIGLTADQLKAAPTFQFAR